MFCVFISVRLFAAGGVVGEAGSCVIKIGFYTAHFTVYQPEYSANDEFCEDLPVAGRTVFILDYLHSTLKLVPVDFRIIKDLQGFGRFVRWENVEQIEDIESQTVFFQPGVVRSDERMRVEYSFASPGKYIGIVTAPHPTKDEIIYRAVFPFDVGNTGYGDWPLILLLILALQMVYMFNRGMFDRFLDKPR